MAKHGCTVYHCSLPYADTLYAAGVIYVHVFANLGLQTFCLLAYHFFITLNQSGYIAVTRHHVGNVGCQPGRHGNLASATLVNHGHALANAKRAFSTCHTAAAHAHEAPAYAVVRKQSYVLDVKPVAKGHVVQCAAYDG